MKFDHCRYDFRSESEVTHQEAILYACGMVMVNGIGVLTINQLFMTGYYNGMKARVAVCSIIYRKVDLISQQCSKNVEKNQIESIMFI